MTANRQPVPRFEGAPPRGVLPPSCTRHFGSPPPPACPMCALERGGLPPPIDPSRSHHAKLAARGETIARRNADLFQRHGTRRKHIEEAAERAKAMHALEAATAVVERTDDEAAIEAGEQPPRQTTAPEQAPRTQEEAPMKNGRPAAMVRFRSEQMSAPQWAKKLGFSTKTVRARIEAGIPLDAPQHPGRNPLAGTWNYVADREMTPKAKRSVVSVSVPAPAIIFTDDLTPAGAKPPPNATPTPVKPNSTSRHGRWVELELADGRFITFDPIDVVGCETADGGAAITIHLRGRGCAFIAPINARALWRYITEAAR